MQTLNLQAVRQIYTVSDSELYGDLARWIRLNYKRCGESETMRKFRITKRQLSKCLEGAKN